MAIDPFGDDNFRYRGFRPGSAFGAAGAIGGIFIIGFGVLWTIMAFAVTANAPFPIVRVVFPLFGVLFVLAGVAAMIGSAASVARVNKIGVLDTPVPPITPTIDAPVPSPSPAPGAEEQAPAGAADDRPPRNFSLIHCAACGEPRRVGGYFCSRCGKPVA